MTALTPTIADRLINCIAATNTDETVAERPIAVRFVVMQTISYIRMVSMLRSRHEGGGAALASTLRFGIIGCGDVGSNVVRSLLSLRGANPANIVVATRQLQRGAGRFKAQGVVVVPSNLQAVHRADVVVISVLPGQLPAVCSELAGKIEKSAIVISTCVAVTADRVCSLLSHPLCLTTNVSPQDVSRFLKCYPDQVKPNPALPTTHTIAQWSFPYRHNDAIDSISHALRCFVGALAAKEKGKPTWNVLSCALASMFGDDVVELMPGELADGGTPTQALIEMCSVGTLSETTGVSMPTLLDYATQQHIRFLTTTTV
eukprot:PhM_4_TR9753/c0_g1_i1/m.35204